MLFIILYKVVLTFESVDKILKSDHPNESYRAIVSCGTFYYDTYLLSLRDKILKCDHSNESH